MMGVAECKLGSSAGLQHAQQAKTLRIQLGQLNSPHGAHVLQQLGLCHFMLGDIQAAIVEFAAWASMLHVDPVLLLSSRTATSSARA